MTATRTTRRSHKALAFAAGAVAWAVCAWLLARTSVPSLHLSGVDQHTLFSGAALRRSARYSRGVDLLWLAGTLASLAALVVLVWRLPPSIRGMGLGRIAAAIVAGMVILVTLWFVALPFGLASLWWDHHFGLGPFDVFAWLDAQWALLGAEVASVMLTIVLLVGFAGRWPRRWWLAAAPTIVVIAAAFAFAEGWLAAAGTSKLDDPQLRADVTRLERAEGVPGTPVRVQDVSSWTNQANAFTTGFGPSTHVVLWNTLLDGRFSRGEIDVVIAHELGHARSRHILKAIGWSALVVLPTLWIVAIATRRRGGIADPANLPYAILVLAIVALVTAPLQNAVSRRYEAEADWRALNATHDPAAAEQLFKSFQTTSLEQPNPSLLDYLWLQNHPTLMQRIVMAQRWRERHRAS
ncbi:MAG TPA: M48 family metalloprotease [Gaiellaceae bacterium]